MKQGSGAQAAAKQAGSGGCGGGAAAREGLRQPGGAAPRIRWPTNDSSGRARALNAAPTSKPAAIMAKRRPGGPAAGCKPLPVTDRGLCSGRHAASCSLAGAARRPGSATLLLAWMAVWGVVQQLERQLGRQGRRREARRACWGRSHCRCWLWRIADRRIDNWTAPSRRGRRRWPQLTSPVLPARLLLVAAAAGASTAMAQALERVQALGAGAAAADRAAAWAELAAAAAADAGAFAFRCPARRCHVPFAMPTLQQRLRCDASACHAAPV